MTDPSGTPPPPSLGRRVREFAGERPGAPAVSCGESTLTWAELDRSTNRLARAMAARGVREGALLTIALPNGIGFVRACVAAWKLGAVPQPVSWRLPRAELDEIVRLARSALVLLPDDLAGPTSPYGVRLGELDADGREATPLPDAVSPSWKAPTSGGSTGRPKLILAGTPGVVDGWASRFWRCGDGDVLLMPGPLYHNGPFSSAFAGFFQGAHLVVMERFDPLRTLELAERWRATWLYLVPTMMNRIWRLPEADRLRPDLSSLRTVWHLAAPCPAWLKQAWIDWLGGERIWELYGGTESIATTVINGAEWLEHRGSVGRPVHGEVTVLDVDGKPLPPGETGEVYMRRTPGTPPTYAYVGAAPRARGEWESLGDMGRLDSDGYLYLADRRPDMILVAGENVYPAEVEAALEEHPGVLSCAVIGLPDEDLGQRVHAIVEGAVPEQELRAHMEERLVRYKLPRSYEFVDRPVRDDAGKVRRSWLIAERTAGRS
ncbi:AMP-binding protein [Planomonospora sp. ID67723]|uniref:AMP-binding protein n=1 Tax=Planomonospora sp. ID67723 TaxID=2738134 RepID=UPI0018C36776|nr:AMP-binding protein [Planomonospora sp. ID67723]MBG0830149.1 AMP-binding protein [Planomonospora sp. ID67723]